jgi:hypothetical protein
MKQTELTRRYEETVSDHGDHFCPHCGHDEVKVLSRIDADVHQAYEIMACPKCHGQWRNYYTFAWVELILPEDGDGTYSDPAVPKSYPTSAPRWCECDNTHEQNGTVCRYCYKANVRAGRPPFWAWWAGRNVQPDVLTGELDEPA